jgi:hypothetical protein
MSLTAKSADVAKPRDTIGFQKAPGPFRHVALGRCICNSLGTSHRFGLPGATRANFGRRQERVLPVPAGTRVMRRLTVDAPTTSGRPNRTVAANVDAAGAVEAIPITGKPVGDSTGSVRHDLLPPSPVATHKRRGTQSLPRRRHRPARRPSRERSGHAASRGHPLDRHL